MDARTLETRLTARLFALAGAVLMAVGAASVLVTSRALEASDTQAARLHAVQARDALARERGEGDSPEEALREVIADAEGADVRLSIRVGSMVGGVPMPPAIATGECELVVDPTGAPWQTCACDGPDGTKIVAGVAVAAHAAVVRTLRRGMAGVLAIALLVMWFAVRRSLYAPLSELAAVVRWTGRIAETGPAEAPPPAHTREIVQLEAAFDGLVRRLFEALARERASSAHIAHELRTPMTAMITELEALRSRNANPDGETNATVGRVLADVARLSDVVDAILVLSSGAQTSERADPVVNVADLARELAPPGTRVDAPDEALIETDERLVRLALRNLLENARKYALGASLVRVSRDGELARLSVIDDGPGLPEDARARMFERYWRGTADTEGRGIGLALVRAVAERYGGRAEAHEGANGRGLHVSMTLRGVVGWHDEPPEDIS